MIVTRFAPSPTGYLHMGHAFAALTAHEYAKSPKGGRFLLRIENIDSSRCRPEFEQAVYDDLSWLGLGWEQPVLRQSSRFGAYRSAQERLDSRGLLYPCFCTRSDILAEVGRAVEAPHGPEGPLYPGTCRNLSRDERQARINSGAVYALRLDARKAAAHIGPLSFEEIGGGPSEERGTITVDPLLFGDVVLARKDAPVSYHLAVVTDDAFQGVTLVSRGNDLFAATHVQRLLQALLGLPVPRYAHHRLILDERGQKLSKRNNAVTLRELRARGITPEHIRAQLGCRIRVVIR
jgi:glutamyl-Q tRNA(Asp) synthetase